MPAAGSTGGRRSGQLFAGLFWAGVGLAPLASLLLLIGEGFLLQIAAVLGVLAVVLIGLSITLRRDGGGRGDAEELLYDEIDHVRDELRQDVANAARATHQALSERIGVLHETVDALRGQIDVMRSHLERSPPAASPAPPSQHHQPPPAGVAGVPGGVLRHTETVQVTTRQTMVVDPTDQRRDGTVYGGGRAPEVPQQRRADRAEWAERPPAQPGADPSEESWTDHLLRERAGRRENDRPARREADRPGGARRAYEDDDRSGERSSGGRRRAYDPEDDGDGVTGVRTTDRWASVRSDERGGRELRVGERRAAMHAGESGAELHIEDRWASVRHEEAREDEEPWREGPRRSEARRERERSGEWSRGTVAGRPEGGGRHGARVDAQWSESSYEEARRDDTGASRWSEVRRERRGAHSPQALPAAPAEPASSWTSGWTDGPREAREARGEERIPRRSRHSDDAEDYGWNGGRGDDRWR